MNSAGERPDGGLAQDVADQTAMGLAQAGGGPSAPALPHSTFELPAPWSRLLMFDAIDSTQLEARRRLNAGETMWGVALWAERQLAGRGRMDHGWVSEAGGLYVTAGLPYDLPLAPAETGWISLIAALAAAETLRLEWGFDARIKWPNDLIVEGYKVGGLLGEVRAVPDGPRQILIGMGINWANGVKLASLPDPEAATAPPGSLGELRPTLPREGREAFLTGWISRLNGWREELGRDYNGALRMLARNVEALLWRREEYILLKHTEQGPMGGRLLGLGSGAAARLEVAPGEVVEVHCGWQSETSPSAGRRTGI